MPVWWMSLHPLGTRESFIVPQYSGNSPRKATLQNAWSLHYSSLEQASVCGKKLYSRLKSSIINVSLAINVMNLSSMDQMRSDASSPRPPPKKVVS